MEEDQEVQEAVEQKDLGEVDLVAVGLGEILVVVEDGGLALVVEDLGLALVEEDARGGDGGAFFELLVGIMLYKWVGTNIAKRGHLYIEGEED